MTGAAKGVKILWVDDEIELLRPHVIFLQEKGFSVDICSNGSDALDMVGNESYDLLFLDEHMPGMSGMETLRAIRETAPALPVIMVTRSEEESLMESAIGSSVTDFLIKPVNPNQMLLAVKKVTEQSRLVTEKVRTHYLEAFNEISGRIGGASTIGDWYSLYRTLVFWQMELERSTDTGLHEIIDSQTEEANTVFARFISSVWERWMAGDDGGGEAPLLSPHVMSRRVLPLLEEERPVVMVVIDNMRFDQWRAIAPLLSNHYRVRSEELYTSILPTATQYSRNALFAGMMPGDIRKQYPQLWVDDDSDQGKNMHEEELLSLLLEREKRDIRWSYEKIMTAGAGRRLNDRYRSIIDSRFTTVVVNAVDMISHSRTDVGVMKELVADEASFRSLTRSWFTHSPVAELLKNLAATDALVVITTDHGNIRVRNPLKIIGDKSTSPNLRYKLGRNLAYDKKEVFAITDPQRARLPAVNISSKFIFATGADFLVYANNYNHYASYYRDTFQHGGISLQEMLCPLVILDPVQ